MQWRVRIYAIEKFLGLRVLGPVSRKRCASPAILQQLTQPWNEGTNGQPRGLANVTTNVERYQRIARLYDLLDLPFERRRYRALRPLLFQGMAGRLLDAGIGTGRNCEFYPSAAIVTGIDTSAAMLARAFQRCATLAADGRLYQMDVTALTFPTGSFDAAVSSFLFCVLPEHLQVMALRELGRVVKPGGIHPTTRVRAPTRHPAPDDLLHLATLDRLGLRCELRSPHRAAYSYGRSRTS